MVHKQNWYWRTCIEREKKCLCVSCRAIKITLYSAIDRKQQHKKNMPRNKGMKPIYSTKYIHTHSPHQLIYRGNPTDTFIKLLHPFLTVKHNNTHASYFTSHTYPVWWPYTVGFVGRLPLNQNFLKMGTYPLSSLFASLHWQLPDTCQGHKSNTHTE